MPPELTDIAGLFAGLSALTMGAICIGTVVTLVITVGVTFLAIKMVRKAVGPDRSTLESGIAARARIVNVRQTGMLVNHQPQIAFTLEVYPPSGTPYQMETKAVIPMVNIPQFQPGAEVPVKIHPANASKVVLDVYR
jgi:hypothetical protein